MNTRGIASSAPAPRTTSQNACLSCRNIKMKCKRDPSSTTCERCLRKSIACIFEKHKRGRKAGMRLAKKSQNQTPLNVTSPLSRGREHAWLPEAASPQTDETIRDTYPRNHLNTNTKGASIQYSEKVTWDDSSALQPAELLNKNAKKGKFSLQNVLSTAADDEVPEEPGTDEYASHHPSPEGNNTPSLDDPVHCGILNFPVALGLFNSFMRSLNPFISQFDPQLHTFEYVQKRSPILLTSILVAAARAFHPPLHSRLRDHSEHLLAKSFTQGAKSPEIIQAVLVSTYWKEPDDVRSWLLVGYAIRMAVELGWHKMQPVTAESQEGDTEITIRENRNLRRTWLILFVYDRSISLQVGKPCMIEQDNFITTAQDWYKQPYAVFGADALLCAFVTLRILSLEIVELVSPDHGSRHIKQGDTLMKLLNANLTRWEECWHLVSDDEQVDHCQVFLIKFYGLHLRLLLNSYSLQESLKASRAGTPVSRQAVWTCYSTAIEMLKQISDKFGPFKLLYFAQDSVHVMTAYAATLLIKLLLSLPTHLSKELETSAIEAILKAASIFESQCASQSTGCALQSRFLNNIAVQFEKAKHQPPKAQISQPTTTARIRAPNMQEAGQSSTQSGLQMVDAKLDQTASDYSARDHTALHPSTQSTDDTSNHLPEQSKETFETEISSWTFENNDQWEAMFANAGYRIYDGVFVPEDSMT